MIPLFYIECKHWSDELKLHNTQLERYFMSTSAKVAILTNGIVYQFFSDIEDNNILDKKPFSEIDLINLKESSVDELIKFQKSLFDLEKIVDSASELKYLKGIKESFELELKEPSTELTKYFAGKVYRGNLTLKIVELFKGIVKRAISQSFSDEVKTRLKSALEKESDKQKVETKEFEGTKEPKIVTTQQELDGFNIVKAIVRKEVDLSRIYYKDTQSYFAINLDKVTQPICRLYFNLIKMKYISLFDENKDETKHRISSLDDIYNHSEELINIVKRYL